MGLFRTDLTPPAVWPVPHDPPSIQRGLDYARLHDPIGHRLHTLFAALHLFTLVLSTAASSISFALLVGYAIVRLPHSWRCYPSLLRVFSLWAMVCFTIWFALSILWSATPLQGLDELRAARMILLPLALWPVLDRAKLLIISALLGLAFQNLSQVLQMVNILDDPAELKGRYRGLLSGQTAMWCLAGMCWHLSAAISLRGKWRWISMLGLIIAGLGLIATGNRGPWIAAAITMPLALLFMGLRHKEGRTFAMVLLGVGIISAGVAWPVAGRFITPRVEKAIKEVQAARDENIYWTSGGLRVGLWRWAIDAFEEKPILGYGAGGYRNALLANPDFLHSQETQQRLAPNSHRMDREHAHSTYFQTLATTGAIGSLLGLIGLGLVLYQVFRDRRDHPYVTGTLFALVGWLIAANFDCYTLNGHLYGMLCFLLALTLPHRAILLCGLWDTQEEKERPLA